MPIIEIVTLRPVHQKSLTGFFEKINLPEYTKDFLPHPFNAENAKRICEYQGKDMYYSILLDGEDIIGYCMLRGWDEGYEIPSVGLCVLKEYQRKGLGRLLLNFLEVVSKSEGASEVMLKVKKDNEIAKRLYKSQKYVFKEYNEEFLIGYKGL